MRHRLIIGRRTLRQGFLLHAGRAFLHEPVAPKVRMVRAAWGLYWFFDSDWGIVQRIEDAWGKYWAEAKTGNVMYLKPLEVPEDYDPEDNWMKSVADDTPLDHKWWAGWLGL